PARKEPSAARCSRNKFPRSRFFLATERNDIDAQALACTALDTEPDAPSFDLVEIAGEHLRAVDRCTQLTIPNAQLHFVRSVAGQRVGLEDLARASAARARRARFHAIQPGQAARAQDDLPVIGRRAPSEEQRDAAGLR